MTVIGYGDSYVRVTAVVSYTSRQVACHLRYRVGEGVDIFITCSIKGCFTYFRRPVCCCCCSQIFCSVGYVAEGNVSIPIVGAFSHNYISAGYLELERTIIICDVVILQGLMSNDLCIALNSNSHVAGLVGVLKCNSCTRVGIFRTVHIGLHRHGAVALIGCCDLHGIGRVVKRVACIVAFARLTFFLDGVGVGHTVVRLVKGHVLERIAHNRYCLAGIACGVLHCSSRTLCNAKLLCCICRVFACSFDGERELIFRHVAVVQLLGDVQSACALCIVIRTSFIGICKFNVVYRRSCCQLSGRCASSIFVCYRNGNGCSIARICYTLVGGSGLSFFYFVNVSTSLVVGNRTEVKVCCCAFLRSADGLVRIAILNSYAHILICFRHRDICHCYICTVCQLARYRTHNKLERVVFSPLMSGEFLG